MITRATFGRLLPALAVAAAASGAAAAPLDLPMDKPTTVNGIESVCTGIGDDATHNPLWKTYPLKIMLAGKGGQWLSDADVTVTLNGKPVVSVHCGGPWILFKLQPGRYHVAGALEGDTAASNVVVPAKGQGRVVLRFRGEGGSLSPEHKPN